MSEPWVGQHYETTRLLLLGESAYSWEENGQVRHPSDRHNCDLVEWAINDFPGCVRGRLGFIVKLSRALANEENPTSEHLQFVWDRVAFTNYIDKSVGSEPRIRPSEDLWKTAHDSFPAFLEQLKPRRVIVLGITMWANMPSTQVFITDHIQGYTLADGSVAYCQAMNHPSRGLSWRELAGVVHFACGNELHWSDDRSGNV